ncbi:MAG TPA: trimeric intracellular cation channel family protein [Gaiellaceae bacterium]|nr:trimeric intracellular cation channel family protein [Gaiellaceae bacterium]
MLLQTLDLAAIFAFGLSGALLAVEKRFDIVGLVVLAVVTAIGGGVLRDLIIGAVPPAAFVHVEYLLVPLAAAVLAFFAHAQLARMLAPVLLFDAAGLALYAVSGTAKAGAHGLGPVSAVTIGVLTAVGGGMLRDVLAGEVPAVVRADSVLYATPAFLAAVVVATARSEHVYGPTVAALVVAGAFTLRVLALWRGWRAPSPRTRP